MRGSPQHNAANSATSRGHRSGRDSPIEGGGSFSLTEEHRASAPQHLPVQLQRGLCMRRVFIPFLTLVALAVLVARNNSLPAAEQPSPGHSWARIVTPAGTRVATPPEALGGATALGVQQESQPEQLRAALPDNPQSVQSSAQKCVSVRTCLRNGDPNVPRFACWAVARYAELQELQRADMSEYERCLWRSDSLTSAKQACEQAQGWCGGIVRDNGLYCSVRGHSRKMVYELRRGGRAVPNAERTSWQPQRNASISCASAAESAYREDEMPPQQQRTEGPGDNVWWSSASSSASSSAVAASAAASTRRFYDDLPPQPPSPPPPPPPPPLPPLPPELQLGPTPNYGTKGGAVEAGSAGSAEAAAVAAAAARSLQRGAKPNVVLMNVDDTGYGDYGFNNPNTDDTPHLDQLRSRGMRFSDLHAGASVCTLPLTLTLTLTFHPTLTRSASRSRWSGARWSTASSTSLTSSFVRPSGWAPSRRSGWCCISRPRCRTRSRSCTRGR